MVPSTLMLLSGFQVTCYCFYWLLFYLGNNKIILVNLSLLKLLN